MSEVNTELIDKMADIPLPLSIQFNSKVMRLEELLGTDESKYRNRQYILESFAGKKGRLMLCNTEISVVEIVAEDDSFKMVIGNPSALEQLSSAALYGDLVLTGSAGRALVPAEAVNEIRPGSIIALEQSPDTPASVLIPEIDYVLYQGEPVTVDDFMGIRITGTEGYFRQDPAGSAVVVGDALLGSQTINPEALGANGPGTIIKFDNTGTPMFFTLTDGSRYRGHLQCFSREELSENPMLVNDIPFLEGSMILTFRVTSQTGVEPVVAETDSTEAKGKRSDISAEAVFSTISDSRAETLLAALPRSGVIWLLKSIEPASAQKHLMSFCLSLPEDERGDFLNAFITAAPSITPLGFRLEIMNRLSCLLDTEELEKTEAYSEAFGTDVKENDPVKAAQAVINVLSEREKQLILQWLEIAGSDYIEELKSGLFIFNDIALLSDKNIQKLLREIDASNLAIALSGISTDDRIIEAVKRNMTERAWKIMQEEISFNKDTSDEKRFGARDNILRILAVLEENGSIVI